MARLLSDIAFEIKRDWKNVYFGAKPYLSAMMQMDSVDQNYGAEDGRSIVNYFLYNASTWKGETARKIKKELNTMVKSKSMKKENTQPKATTNTKAPIKTASKKVVKESSIKTAPTSFTPASKSKLDLTGKKLPSYESLTENSKIKRPDFLTEEQDRVIRAIIAKRVKEGVKNLKLNEAETPASPSNPAGKPSVAQTGSSAPKAPDSGSKSVAPKSGASTSIPKSTGKSDMDKDINPTDDLDDVGADENNALGNEYNQLRKRIFLYLRKSGVSAFESNNILSIINEFIDSTIKKGFSRQDVFITRSFMKKYITKNSNDVKYTGKK